MTQTTPRYVVEPGTDGSWLVVDRGGDRTGRRAIGRFIDEQDARGEARVLSHGEDLIAALPAPAPDPDFDAVFAAVLEYTQAVDEAHSFDHLLQARP